MALNERQREQLFKPINPKRVQVLQGKNYLEAWDVIAHLNRIFGFEGWSKMVLSTDLIFEDKHEKGGWNVAYRSVVRLMILGVPVKTSEDAGTGSAQNQPNRGDAHDLALKTAVSDGLKRCAKDLGNQFGLSLSDHGNTGSVVGRSLAYDPLAPDTDVTPPADIGAKVADARDRILGETSQEA
jgi:recombination DNA repair RAD52 pathway protein